MTPPVRGRGFAGGMEHPRFGVRTTPGARPTARRGPAASVPPARSQGFCVPWIAGARQQERAMVKRKTPTPKAKRAIVKHMVKDAKKLRAAYAKGKRKKIEAAFGRLSAAMIDVDPKGVNNQPPVARKGHRCGATGSSYDRPSLIASSGA